MGTIFDMVTEQVTKSSELTAEMQQSILQHLRVLQTKTLNILFVGATGVGKSTTINAIFKREVAVIGKTPDPETDTIDRYALDNLVLWDSPGLGDTPEKDKLYEEQIGTLLRKKTASGSYLIDAVLVIVDGSTRDMATTFHLIEDVLAPALGDDSRIVIGVNKTDLMMSGRGWNAETDQPELCLLEYAEAKRNSVSRRILESTGIRAEPVCYSAEHQYNFPRLLLTILNAIPLEKRFMIADKLNSSTKTWSNSDSQQDYGSKIKETIRISLTAAIKGASECATSGAAVGSLIPFIGPAIGAAVGGLLGFMGGLLGI